MRKILLLVFMLLLGVIALTACGSEEKTESKYQLTEETI